MADYVHAGIVLQVSGSSGSGIAGVAIAQGEWLYIDTADSNKLKLADCVVSAETSVLAGMALHAALAGQPIKYAKPGAVVDPGTNVLVVAETYVLSEAGAMAPVADLVSLDYLSYCCYATAVDALTIIGTSVGVQVP